MVFCSVVHFYAGEHAGAYAFVGIGDAQFDGERARSRVDGRINQVDDGFKRFVTVDVKREINFHAF